MGAEVNVGGQATCPVLTETESRRKIFIKLRHVKFRENVFGNISVSTCGQLDIRAYMAKLMGELLQLFAENKTSNQIKPDCLLFQHDSRSVSMLPASTTVHVCTVSISCYTNLNPLFTMVYILPTGRH